MQGTIEVSVIWENEEYPHEYPFVLIKVLAEPTSGSENRVASYIEYNGLGNRASKLFIERSPPSMEWLEKVFQLIKETKSLGIISGGLQEIRINCEDKIEIQEDKPRLIDREEKKMYFDDDGAGECKDIQK